MNQQALDAWRNRPMSVTVKEICPRCNTLSVGVQSRTMFGAWGQRFTEICCQPCAPVVQAEYLGV
jgi:hypothetical protein